MTRPVRSVLAIAGSDSGGGAGIQADLKTFAAHGLFGTTAVTAVTAQNTVGVTSVQVLPSEIVTAQIEAVASDIELHATKIGMLGTAAVVEAVAAAIEELDLPLVVVDPVMVAKSGDRLLDDDAVGMIRTELLPRAMVATPNIPEAEALTGRLIGDLDAMRAAARRLHDDTGIAVIVKGGHAHHAEIVDVLFDGHELYEFRTERQQTKNTHGTGCTFASAVACYLALGFALPEAAGRAQEYVAGAIRHALAVGHGHGPLDHFWRMRPSAGAAP